MRDGRTNGTMDGPTDQWTDGRMDGQTEPLIEKVCKDDAACPP